MSPSSPRPLLSTSAVKKWTGKIASLQLLKQKKRASHPEIRGDVSKLLRFIKQHLEYGKQERTKELIGIFNRDSKRIANLENKVITFIVINA